MKEMKPLLKDDVLYLGDNGRCLCGEHSGMSARYTRRDISGQKVMPLTPKVIEQMRQSGEPACVLKCEEPRCKRQVEV